MSADARPVSRGAKALAIALALLAPARMAWIVFTYGENNLSDDYIGRAHVVVRILQGRYDFRNLFNDTFIPSGHSWLGLLPFYCFDARFFAWDVDVELGIGLVLAAVKTILLWLAVATSLSERARWSLLPVLSALAFSVSQIASFTFGESVLQMQLPQVGLALGTFAIARFESRPNARISLVAIGGLLASWSWGGGVMVWPVCFVALFAVGEQSLRRWSLLGLTAALGLSQYSWFLVVHHSPSSIERPGLSQPLRYLDLVGRPFGNETGWRYEPLPAAVLFGAVGLLLVGATVATGRRHLRAQIPALTILGWSLLVALEIGFFRRAAAPWYIVPMAAFWLGLACLLAAAPRLLAWAGFATILVGLLLSNRTWEDKSFYLPSRSPASAACLRDWRTAPAGCRERVFQWGGPDIGELAGLGELLERHHLSVFGPRRTYLLQGDVAVGRVTFETTNLPSFFSADGRTRRNVDDFRRLDLVLAPSASVSWRVDLPPGAHRATFSTVVRAASGDPQLGRGARVSVTAKDSSASLEERVFLPRETARFLSVDLSSLAGKCVTLRLAAEETQEGKAPLVFEAPKICLRILN